MVHRQRATFVAAIGMALVTACATGGIVLQDASLTVALLFALLSAIVGVGFHEMGRVFEVLNRVARRDATTAYYVALRQYLGMLLISVTAVIKSSLCTYSMLLLTLRIDGSLTSAAHLALQAAALSHMTSLWVIAKCLPSLLVEGTEQGRGREGAAGSKQA